MKISETGFDGLYLLQPNVFEDERGYFFEAFNQNVFNNSDLRFNFIQDNISRSKKNTIRGLHFQTGEMAQGKLCQVIYGKVLDVALDIRFNSPTFGKYFSTELSEENHLQLWMHPGFAHGFSVLSDIAIFSYKCTKMYSKEHESTILFNDPDLNIDWQVKDPVVSEKDLNAQTFKAFIKKWQKV